MPRKAMKRHAAAQGYPLLMGIVVGLLGAGLAVPFVVGGTVVSTSGNNSGTATHGPAATGGGGVSGSEDGVVEDAGGNTAGPAGSGASTAGAATGRVDTNNANGAPGVSSTKPGTAAALTATDRGVSATTIKLGFLLVDLGSLDRLGIDVGVNREEQQAARQAFVDDINARGGIHGRQIEAYFTGHDVTNGDSMIAACRKQTQDNKVFAVIGGFTRPDATLCTVDENQTPLLDDVYPSPDWVVARAGGRLFTFFQASGRQIATTVSELERVGLIGKKLGILADDLTDPGGHVATALQRVLTAQGAEVVYRGHLSSDLSVGASQIPIEVNKAQTSGAEVIVNLANHSVYGTQFVNQAEGQRYRPQYVSTDWSGGTRDVSNQNMPESYEGALAFTAAVGHGHAMGPPRESAQAAQCRQAFERQTGRKLPPMGSDEYAAAMGACDPIRIFEAAANAAGPNLTRPALSAAVQGLGATPLAYYGGGSFGPNKFDYSDLVRTMRWQFDCRCWARVDEFHPPGG